MLRLTIIGALCGAAVGGAWFGLRRLINPSYTAHIAFQVSSPRHVIGGSNLTPSSFNPETHINGAELMLFSTGFLEEVIKAPEFHKQTNGLPGDPAWMIDHKGHEVASLRHDLELIRLPHGSHFEITMTTHNPAEAAALVSGVARLLHEQLETSYRSASQREVSMFRDARAKSQAQMAVQMESLITWSKVNQVDVLNTRYDIEKMELQAYDAAVVNASQAAVMAGSKLASANALLNDRKPILLPAETERDIEQDITLRQLAEVQNTLAQEQAAESQRASPNRERLSELQARSEKVSEQIRATREQKIGAASDRYVQRLTQDKDEKLALRRSLEDTASIKRETMLRIGEVMMEFQHRMNQYTQVKDLFLGLERDFQTVMINSGGDVSPVQTTTARANVPDSPSAPNWPPHIGFGALAGACLGLVAAAVRRGA